MSDQATTTSAVFGLGEICMYKTFMQVMIVGFNEAQKPILRLYNPDDKLYSGMAFTAEASDLSKLRE